MRICMKPLLLSITFGCLTCAGLVHAEPKSVPAPGSQTTEINKTCPVSGKPADPAVTTEYEGVIYAFATATDRQIWLTARENSLYHKLGGKAALDAGVESFYVKVLKDDRIKHFFEDINMNKQRRKQKEFLSAALGGPITWKGKDMREAHADLDLEEIHFTAVAEHLQKTLEELKVPKELSDQVMKVVGSVHDDVLNLPKKAK